MAKKPLASMPPSRPLLYVKAGVTPVDWKNVSVIRLSTGKAIADVLEADAFNGWIVQAVREKGQLVRTATGALVTRRLPMKIRLDRRK